MRSRNCAARARALLRACTAASDRPGLSSCAATAPTSLSSSMPNTARVRPRAGRERSSAASTAAAASLCATSNTHSTAPGTNCMRPGRLHRAQRRGNGRGPQWPWRPQGRVRAQRHGGIAVLDASLQRRRRQRVECNVAGAIVPAAVRMDSPAKVGAGDERLDAERGECRGHGGRHARRRPARRCGRTGRFRPSRRRSARASRPASRDDRARRSTGPRRRHRRCWWHRAARRGRPRARSPRRRRRGTAAARRAY